MTLLPMYGPCRSYLRPPTAAVAVTRIDHAYGTPVMIKLHTALLVRAAAVVAGLGAAWPADAADQLLTGAIASATGQKLDGVVVSAKREGSTVTTSVYTDVTGNYYFPPLAGGKY